MIAYCNKCLGLGVTLAPTSQSTTGPVTVGTVTPIPGRLMPGKVRIRNCEAATHAPVFPAEMTTSASFFEASLHITAMELSGLDLIASTGDSSIPTTCVVWTITYRFF